jgi:hypothetical protein
MEDDPELMEAIEMSLKHENYKKIPKLASPGSSYQVSIPDKEEFFQIPAKEEFFQIPDKEEFFQIPKEDPIQIIDDFDDLDDEMMKIIQESINEEKIKEDRRIKEEQNREHEEAVKRDLQQKNMREIEENKKRLQELQKEKRKKVQHMKINKLKPPILKYPLIGDEPSEIIYNIQVRLPDSRILQYKFNAKEPYISLIEQIRYDFKYIKEFELFTGLGRFRNILKYTDEIPLQECNIQQNTFLTFVEI